MPEAAMNEYGRPILQSDKIMSAVEFARMDAARSSFN